jgi:hypothetical protein
MRLTLENAAPAQSKHTSGLPGATQNRNRSLEMESIKFAHVFVSKMIQNGAKMKPKSTPESPQEHPKGPLTEIARSM